MLPGGRLLREIDLATGTVLRTFDSGKRQRAGATYIGDALAVGSSWWKGGIWTADLSR